MQVEVTMRRSVFRGQLPSSIYLYQSRDSRRQAPLGVMHWKSKTTQFVQDAAPIWVGVPSRDGLTHQAPALSLHLPFPGASVSLALNCPWPPVHTQISCLVRPSSEVTGGQGMGWPRKGGSWVWGL